MEMFLNFFLTNTIEVIILVLKASACRIGGKTAAKECRKRQGERDWPNRANGRKAYQAL
jgi:hypothetical protein